MSPTVPDHIFRSYDIRGIVGADFDAALFEDIARAIGSEAVAQGVSRIALGRDGRLSGPELMAAVSRGLQASGLEVLNIGCVPTPLLYYVATTETAGSGVMLTGSHNPPDYNGLKIMLKGVSLAQQSVQDLKQRVLARNFSQGEGSQRQEDFSPAYIRRIVEDVQLARPLRIVVDCGNGSAGEVALQLFGELGCEVVPLYCSIDGRFPHHHPDPSRPDNLQDLQAAVLKHGADLGLAFDGDGDRVGVISPSGQVIWPDRYLNILAADVLARHPGACILYDVKCSRHLGESIRALGGRPLMAPSGHSLMKQKMQESGALLGGELSGHIFIKERWYGFDDALYAAARLLEILSRESAPIQSRFDALPDAVNTPELLLPMAEGAHYALMDRLLARPELFGAGRKTTIDGLRVDYEDGWALVRASNTTPCLVLRFEANSSEQLQAIQAIFRAALLELDPELTLPF